MPHCDNARAFAPTQAITVELRVNADISIVRPATVELEVVTYKSWLDVGCLFAVAETT